MFILILRRCVTVCARVPVKRLKQVFFLLRRSVLRVPNKIIRRRYIIIIIIAKENARNRTVEMKIGFFFVNFIKLFE